MEASKKSMLLSRLQQAMDQGVTLRAYRPETGTNPSTEAPRIESPSTETVLSDLALGELRSLAEFFLAPIDQIDVDGDQVRQRNKTAKDVEVQQLGKSVKELGVLQPLSVYRSQSGIGYG